MIESVKFMLNDFILVVEELRRLHALNAELVEALRGLSDEVEHFGLHHPGGNSNWWPVDLEKAREVLAKVEESK